MRYTLVLSLALLAAACDSSDAPELPGDFSATVSGAESFELDGGASFSEGVLLDETVVSLNLTPNPDNDPRASVVFSLRYPAGAAIDADTLFVGGRFAVPPYVTITVLGRPRLLVAVEGEVVLTRVEEEVIEGTFEAGLVEGFVAFPDSTLEPTHRITGEFEAVSRDVGTCGRKGRCG